MGLFLVILAENFAQGFIVLLATLFIVRGGTYARAFSIFVLIPLVVMIFIGSKDTIPKDRFAEMMLAMLAACGIGAFLGVLWKKKPVLVATEPSQLSRIVYPAKVKR